MEQDLLDYEQLKNKGSTISLTLYFFPEQNREQLIQVDRYV